MTTLVALRNDGGEIDQTVAEHAPRWWHWLIIALVAIGVYANSIPNDFAFDDLAIVKGNPAVENQQWLELWSQNYWPSKGDILYRPLTIWSYAMNRRFSPVAAWPFHATNVLLHAVVSVLVGMVGWRLLRSRAVAVGAGILFAVHPLHTEVVANVVGRAELISSIWSLAALLVFLPEGELWTRPERPRGWWHGWLVALCVLLGLLAKETPVPFIAGFAVIDLLRWCNWRWPKPRLCRYGVSRVLRYHLPIAIAFAIYMAMRIHGAGLRVNVNSIHPLVNPLVVASLMERAVTPFLLVTKYVTLLFWPAVLSADYSAPSIMPVSNPLQLMPLVGMLIVGTTLLLAILNWRKNPGAVTVAIMMGLSYFMVSNVIRIGTIFGERLFYLPSVFVLILAAFLLLKLLERIGRRNAASLTLAMILLASVPLGWKSVAQNPVWHDNTALAMATAYSNPQSAKACDWAGTILIGQSNPEWMQKFGVTLLERALELYPKAGGSNWSLMGYYGRKGDHCSALLYLARAAETAGGNAETRLALRMVDVELPRHPQEPYLAAIQKALADPENKSKGWPHMAYGLLLRSQGKYKEAEAQMLAAVKINPLFAEAAAEWGMMAAHRGDYENAVASLRQYVKSTPNNGVARCDLAYALLAMDEAKYPLALPEARMNIEKAEAILPDDANVRRLRAELRRRDAAAKRPVRTVAQR